MGMIPPLSGGTVEIPTNNPDPLNFKILKTVKFGKYLVVKVNYPDATSFEGVKILVLECSEATLKSLKALDPHFHEDQGKYRNIARFEPTEDGWSNAINFVEVLNKKWKK